eukprot:GHVU01030110.1.p1 GENE.GHVU01030110.1~~GHVU01030110.1.p1  ORF type:complete len:126 (-),score=7.20 GHVU01030110.1:267-644(-)
MINIGKERERTKRKERNKRKRRERVTVVRGRGSRGRPEPRQVHGGPLLARLTSIGPSALNRPTALVDSIIDHCCGDGGDRLPPRRRLSNETHLPSVVSSMYATDEARGVDAGLRPHPHRHRWTSK